MINAMNEKILKETRRFIEKQSPDNETVVSRDSIKFHLNGKLALTVYIRENKISFLLIMDKDDCRRFEALKDSVPGDICEIYDNTNKYHDYKWLMIPVFDFDRLMAVEKIIGANAS